MKRSLLACAALCQFGWAIAASEVPLEAGDLPSVAVQGIRNPELQPYRHMLAGLDMFERRRDLAPAASGLTFLIRPKHARESLAGLTLRIASEQTSIDVPIAPDGSFALPRDEAAADSDADLILNRTRGQFTAIPQVRSAGVPAGMRRLGDIRLECQVAVAIAKKRFNVATRAAAAVAMAGTDWCQSSRIHYGVSTPGPVDSVTLVAGPRRVTLLQGRQLKQYEAPLADRSWPDDTLIEFQPSAPATGADFNAGPLYLRGTMNKWDTSLPLRQIDATTFGVDVRLPDGISKFRIASADLRMVNLGASDSKANETKGDFKINAGKTLAWAGNDIWFEPPRAGNYAFTLNAADPQAPVLTIAPLD